MVVVLLRWGVSWGGIGGDAGIVETAVGDGRVGFVELEDEDHVYVREMRVDWRREEN